MKTTCFSIRNVALATLVAIAVPNVASAENLADRLREAKWDHVIGTWVDEDSGGEAFQLAFAWKFEDQLIEVTSKYEDRESVALMGINGKSRNVFHMGADNQGGSVRGNWNVEENGDAVLKAEYTLADGKEGEMSIRFQRVDTDTTVMKIETTEPIEVRLVRK